MTSAILNGGVRSYLTLVLLASLACPSQAYEKPPHVADPFADPKNDPWNPLRYIASNALTGTAVELIFWTAVAHAVCLWKWRAWWMLCLILGEFTFAFGIACRWALHKYPDSKGWYIPEYLCIILSPCAFIAADYIILGRLVRYLRCEQHLRLVSPKHIMPFFLSSDITTFLIQAAGGGISLGNGPNSAQNGGHIFLAGLVLQLVSFLIYTAIFTTFTYRVRKYEPTVWAKDAGMRWYNDWRALAGALGLSCVGIIIRSCYRVAEMSEGFLGSLSTTEGYFYGLDTLPLFIAIVVYIPFWPGRFIRASSQSGVADEEKTNHDGNANGDASDRVGSEEFAAVTEVT